MFKAKLRYTLLAMAIVAAPSGAAFAQDASLELIGGVSMGLLISTNLNVGMAAELHKADPRNADKAVLVAETVDKQLTVNLAQFAKWQKMTRLTAEDQQYLDMLAKGLVKVQEQARLLKTAISEKKETQLNEYHARRKETSEIIKKLTE